MSQNVCKKHDSVTYGNSNIHLIYHHVPQNHLVFEALFDVSLFFLRKDYLSLCSYEKERIVKFNFSQKYQLRKLKQKVRISIMRPSKKAKSSRTNEEPVNIDVNIDAALDFPVVEEVQQVEQAPLVQIARRNNLANTIDVKPFTKLFQRMIDNQDIQPLITPREYAKCLKKYGYIVIPIYDQNTVNQKHAEFKQCLAGMPEYKHPMPKWRKEEYYVKGGFGALGNPSSFHNTFVRQVRKDAMKKVIPIFSEFKTLFGDDLREHKLEQLVDRMRVLRPKADIMHESWHRDTTPLTYASEDDVIFGGWISFDKLNAKAQRFSAFHKSHRTLPINMETRNEGFTKATSEQSTQLDQLKQAYLTETHNDGWYIEVPSGHMLIFQQEMIHEVKKADSGMSEPSLRLFTAWRLTRSVDRFMAAQHPYFFDKMTVPLLKSGQKIPMWPNANWKPNAWGGLSDWSETTFKRLFLERREMKSIRESKLIIPEFFKYGMNDISIKLQAEHLIQQARENDIEGDRDAANIYTTIAYDTTPGVWRSMYSDIELQLNGIDPTDNFYPQYTHEEIALLTPNVEWVIDGQEYAL